MESRKGIDSQHCADGCGFNGSIENQNLCSKCDKEEIEKESMEETLKPTSPPPPPNVPFAFTKSKPRSVFSFNTKNIPDSKSFFGFSSSSNKQFSFSADSTVETWISPRVDASKFLFGSSTGRKRVCSTCNKRVGLTGFECRCGNLFCGKHRYPEEHSCGFDYKAYAREIMLKQNQVCEADKLHYRI
ncbi:hypothetical protein P3X46_030657 [Hevea brasiliensis]|uniref:AN1-type domain-containing protein n=1 Tax=Hevea brasiliensis TaxID=3981 RepID=A0ABQ9KKW0_HEVBR|nr:zinc finger A20 and AN1 domain-containing stress-associated protein 1 [Hevea brasiliensis]KAJ9139966.1 hypothetical protein P3X46_030657 [Hevea brasiliensis]